MKVWGVFLNYTDGATYSCECLHKLYSTQHAAEVEQTRIDLMRLENEEFEKYWKLSSEDQNLVDSESAYVEEWEVE